MDIFILMCWSIWKERNEWIFQGIDPTVTSCRARFFNELSLVVHRAKRGHADQIES